MTRETPIDPAPECEHAEDVAGASGVSSRWFSDLMSFCATAMAMDMSSGMTADLAERVRRLHNSSKP